LIEQAKSAHLIQSTLGSSSPDLGQGALAGSLAVPSMSKDIALCLLDQPVRLSAFLVSMGARAGLREERAQGFDRCWVRLARKRLSVEREGKRSRPKSAMKAEQRDAGACRRLPASLRH